MNFTLLVSRMVILAMCLAFSTSYADNYNTPIDEGIVSSIESFIALDDDLSESDVEVSSHNGIVTLEGEVDSLAEKNRVVDVAESTQGVVKVNADGLTVKD